MGSWFGWAQRDKADEVEATLMRVEGHMKQFEESSGRPLGEAISAIVLMSTCVRDLSERLEYDTKDMS